MSVVPHFFFRSASVGWRGRKNENWFEAVPMAEDDEAFEVAPEEVSSQPHTTPLERGGTLCPRARSTTERARRLLQPALTVNRAAAEGNVSLLKRLLAEGASANDLSEVSSTASSCERCFLGLSSSLSTAPDRKLTGPRLACLS